MGLHCAWSIKEISLWYFLCGVPIISSTYVRYCHGSSGCIVVCLSLPCTSQSALFSPFIDQQELDEFSYSDAPRQQADECPSGTRTFFALLTPCIIKQGFENSSNFCNLKKIICSYIIPTFAQQPSRRDSSLLTITVFLLFSFCHVDLLEML